MENKSNFRVFNSPHMHCDINQLASFVSVNQTQNATISTTKFNRINHNRTFRIVNKLVRQFCVCLSFRITMRWDSNWYLISKMTMQKLTTCIRRHKVKLMNNEKGKLKSILWKIIYIISRVCCYVAFIVFEGVRETK